MDVAYYRDLLFNFDGRINRGKYWLAFLVWIIAWCIAAVVMFLFSYWLFYVVIGLMILLGVLGILSGIAVGIKRLHDRNKSGWWLLLFYLLPGLLDGIGRGAGSIGLIFSLASFVITIWAFVELGCMRGTDGPNTYGPDPLAAVAAQPA
ncbi:MAG TPA: DUF805 domain-containing protein [Xanthobacteraceae bacterium]|jgi:uncharacterized membrane protein YhaH (DUF805 family)|nr:DUF805 domain-containing protein [Xanthobacteraceae bacterium]